MDYREQIAGLVQEARWANHYGLLLRYMGPECGQDMFDQARLILTQARALKTIAHQKSLDMVARVASEVDFICESATVGEIVSNARGFNRLARQAIYSDSVDSLFVELLMNRAREVKALSRNGV